MTLAPQTTEQLLIDVADAAALLAVSRITVRRMLKAGILPTVKIAKAVRIPLAAVVALATPSAAVCGTSIANADEDDEPAS